MVRITDNSVELADDDEVILGTNSDAKIVYDSANDELVVIDSNASQDLIKFPMDGTGNTTFPNRAPDVTSLDGTSGTTGQFLQTDGTSLTFADVSAGGKFEKALSNGQILASDGNLYSSIQTAVNSVSNEGWLFIGQGTFNESVTISKGITIIGASPHQTIIDSGNNDTISVDLANSIGDVEIRNLHLKNDTANFNDGLSFATSVTGYSAKAINVYATAGGTGVKVGDGNAKYAVAKGCKAFQSGFYGIRASANQHSIVRNSITQAGVITAGTSDGGGVISGCVADNNDGDGIKTLGPNVVIEGNRVVNAGTVGIEVDNDDCVVANNVVNGSSTEGIYINFFSDSIVIGNRVSGAGAHGILDKGTDNLIANNRVSGSTNSNINTANATTPTTDANVTGSAN